MGVKLEDLSYNRIMFTHKELALHPISKNLFESVQWFKGNPRGHFD